MAAEGDGALPVDRGIEPRIGIRRRIGHDMRGGIGDAVERRLRGGEIARRTRGIGREPAAGDGKIERGHLLVTLRLYGRTDVRPQRYRTSLTHAPLPPIAYGLSSRPSEPVNRARASRDPVIHGRRECTNRFDYWIPALPRRAKPGSLGRNDRQGLFVA